MVWIETANESKQQFNIQMKLKYLIRSESAVQLRKAWMKELPCISFYSLDNLFVYFSKFMWPFIRTDLPFVIKLLFSFEIYPVPQNDDFFKYYNKILTEDFSFTHF